jgi:protein-disulfide isomerase
VLSSAAVPAPRRRLSPSLLALAAVLAACGGGAGSDPLPSRVAVEVAGRPQRGPADAWVTLVEFSDFECPFCQKVEPTLAQLSVEYGSDLRLVYRHLPLVGIHARARPAAIAAECAFAQGEPAFWAYHDLLFGSGALDDAALAAQAADAGLDVAAWAGCAAGADAGAAVDADAAAARAAGVNGTPTFFVNGVPLVGARPIGEFRTAIDRALAEARASGLTRAEYYDRAVLGR